MKNCRQCSTFSKPPSPARRLFTRSMSTNAAAATFAASSASSGDIEKGFKEADEIIENTYNLPPVQHGHIEPHVATAYWEPSGKLVVHSA